MKKTTTLLYGIPITLLLTVGSYDGYTFRSGPANGLSGSPTSQGTCGNSGCHSGGSNSGQSIAWSSDIPAAGYEDNTNYTITVSLDASSSSADRMGMHASIEDASGSVGTVQNANGDSKVVDTYFVSHTQAGSTGSGGMKDYQFSWNSGASAPPMATLYVTANFANGDGGVGGDFILSETFVLNKQNIGLGEHFISNISTYPNPASDYLTLSGTLKESGRVVVSLYSLDGKKIVELANENRASGDFEWEISIPSVPSGNYLLFMEGNNASSHQKISLF